MRTVAVCIAALLMGACGQPPRTQSAELGCARTATHEVTWTDASAPDVITTSSEGPSCAQAVVTFVARNARGDPLWAFASTHYAMTAGDSPPIDGAPAVADSEMDTFLASWADVTEMRSSELPEWRDGVATLTESAETFAYDTPFEREVYEALRARDAPMICYAAAVESSQCLIVDPATHTPTLMVAYGP